MSIWKRYTNQEKEEILEEFEKSTEGQKVFCKRKKMSPTTLRTWLKESKGNKKNNNKKQKRSDFGVIHLSAIKETPIKTNVRKEPEEIYFKCDNIEIKLQKGYDKVTLQKIFEVFAYVE